MEGHLEGEATEVKSFSGNVYQGHLLVLVPTLGNVQKGSVGLEEHFPPWITVVPTA